MARLEVGALLLDDDARTTSTSTAKIDTGTNSKATTGHQHHQQQQQQQQQQVGRTTTTMGNSHGSVSAQSARPPVASVIGSVKPRRRTSLVDQTVAAAATTTTTVRVKGQQGLQDALAQDDDDDERHVYEDVQVNGNVGPPKIMPVSGVLSTGKVVIRPIAFKPLVKPSSSSSSSSPSSPPAAGGSTVVTTGTSTSAGTERSSSMPSVTAAISPNFSASPSSSSSSSSSKEPAVLQPTTTSTTSTTYTTPNHQSIFSTSGSFSRVQGVGRKNCVLSGSVTSVNLCGRGSGSVLSVAGNGNGNGNGNGHPCSPSDYYSESESHRRSNRGHNQWSVQYGTTRTGTNSNGGGLSSFTRQQQQQQQQQHGGSLLHLGGSGYSTTDSCLKLPLSDTPQSLFSSSTDDLLLTPSPSDSGVAAELEAMLKEKDSEINYLRETMEQNEQVIFKVYEEKEVGWHKELKRVKGHYDAKVKACQQRALKMEQVLMMQTYQLQQDKRKLRQDLDELKRERDQSVDELKRELELTRGQLEETEWKLCQKSGEISLLKSRVKELQGEQTGRAVELLHLRTELKQVRAELDQQQQQQQQQYTSQQNHRQGQRKGKDDEENGASEVRSRELRTELERLEADVDAAKTRLAAQRSTFEEERVRWLDEKEKVIRYQKQLQLNYVQMYRRNRTLESEVEQLTLELEGRDLKLINGTESQC